MENYESFIKDVGEPCEIGLRLEDINNNLEDFKFDENENNYLEETLSHEGVLELDDLKSVDVKELVESVDDRVKHLRPNLPTKVHMGYFGKESGVWKEFRNYLEPKYLEAPLDKIQQEQIASTMFEMNELRFENWSNLSIKGKVNVLNELEQKIAAIAHRPAATIYSEILDDDLFGYQLKGDIVINEKLLVAGELEPSVLDKMFETLIHEGRHAYQHYNVEERMVHQSEAEVESWRENFEVVGYAKGEPIKIPLIGNFTYTDAGLAQIGARLYYYQPVEIDARNFAADTMAAYRKYFNAYRYE